MLIVLFILPEQGLFTWRRRDLKLSETTWREMLILFWLQLPGSGQRSVFLRSVVLPVFSVRTSKNKTLAYIKFSLKINTTWPDNFTVLLAAHQQSKPTWQHKTTFRLWLTTRALCVSVTAQCRQRAASRVQEHVPAAAAASCSTTNSSG